MANECLGKNKKGYKCSRKVLNGEWCVYHQSQRPTSRVVANTKSNGSKTASKWQTNSGSKLVGCKYDTPVIHAAYTGKPGYIYVYTHSSFLSKEGNGWVQVKNLTNNKHLINKWVDVDMKHLKTILIKVGMTTKTPAVRILQWEEKCKHKLACLYPGSHNLRDNGLLGAFKRLSLLKSEPKLKTYVSAFKGFWAPRDVFLAEKKIHALLKGRYGRGEIHCTECSDKPQQGKSRCFWPFSKSSQPAPHNIHNEWFPVPKKDIAMIFQLIDSVCSTY